MFVSHLSGFPQGVWGNHTSLQVNNPKSGILGENCPTQDVLGRVSKNLLQAQKQTSLQDRLELKFSSVLEAEPSSLSEVPTGILKIYAHLMYLGDTQAANTERALTEYRDQLTAFDQTIQEYQEMLDGQMDLPEHMSPDQVQAMLDLVKETRAKFLQDGAKEVNSYLSYSKILAQDKRVNQITSMFSEGSGSYGDGASNAWGIDPNAEDIYGEIDRALGTVQSRSRAYQKSYSAIAAELARRGEDPLPCNGYFLRRAAQVDTNPTDALLSHLLERTWSDFREKSRDISAWKQAT